MRTAFEKTSWVFFILAAGCAAPRSMIKGDTIISNIQRVAVLPFDASPDITHGEEIGLEISEYLVTPLSHISRWEIMERAHLEQLLNEQGLQLSGLFKEGNFRALRELLGVDAVLVGHVSEHRRIPTSWGAKHVPWSVVLGVATLGIGFVTFNPTQYPDDTFAVALTIRLVSLKTGRILLSESARADRGTKFEAVRDACRLTLQRLFDPHTINMSTEFQAYPIPRAPGSRIR